MKDGALYYRSSGQESIFFDRIRQRDIKKIIPKDIVLIRGNGYPTYHLASLCDDYIGNVTDIIRSSDHIDSTLIHHLVFNRIGSIKRFWIIPLIYDENKQKLSKSRQDTLSLETLIRKEGILPQTFLGYFNEHKDSHRPFQFDINILKRMNRKYMTYNNIIEVIHKGLQSLYGKINVINLAYFKDLIDSGRYTNLNQLMIEIDILKPALDRLLDHYISNNLDRFWMNLLQNWFDKREISTLNTEHKIYFRENLLNLNKGPSIEECLKILFLIFKDRDDDEEESKQVQN